MRTICAKTIEDTICDLCIEANERLESDLLNKINESAMRESSPIGKAVFDAIQRNLALAHQKELPICQDTGMAVVFATVGQDVHIEKGNLTDAINEGVRRGYTQGYLRKSVVADPLKRINTEDNTPAVIHYDIVPGENIILEVMPKGFGSENTSALKMLKPSDGVEGVEAFILETIEKGAPNACAPIVVGVGIGGTFEKAALIAKKALARPISEHNPQEDYAAMERRLLLKANNLGIGPMGLGGITTVLGIAIDTFPTHIAGLPVAVNICCYVDRHAKKIL